jgi:hypothetical protein
VPIRMKTADVDAFKQVVKALDGNGAIDMHLGAYEWTGTDRQRQAPIAGKVATLLTNY